MLVYWRVIIQPTTLSERNSQILGDSWSFSLPINPIVYGKLGVFLMEIYTAKRWIFPQVCELWFVRSYGLIAMEIGYALLLLLGLGIYIQSSCSKLARHTIEKLPFGRCMFTAGYQKSHAPRIQNNYRHKYLLAMLPFIKFL